MKFLALHGLLEHWCPGCQRVHSVNVHDLNRNGQVIGWDGDRESPSFGQTVTIQTSDGVCEYIMRGGVQYFTENCTHELRNQSRHLEDF